MAKFTDILSEGIESLKTIKQDKAEYRAYLARIEALPEEYHFVYKKITEYMWGCSGGGDGYDMIALQAGMVELFEDGVATGRSVLEITGEDVAAFADELLRGAKTYSDVRHHKLNGTIHKHIGKN